MDCLPCNYYIPFIANTRHVIQRIRDAGCSVDLSGLRFWFRMLDWCEVWLHSSTIELNPWFLFCVMNLLFVLSDHDTKEWLTLKQIRSELLDLESDQYYKVFHSRLIECLFLDCDVLLGKSIPVYHGLKVWAQDLTEDVVVVLPYHDGFLLLTGGLVVAFPTFTFFNFLIRNSSCEPRCRV